MGRARKAKKARKANPTVARFIRPTEAREAHNDFRSAGAAMRVVPVIVRLHEQKVLTDREFEALAYYRDQASLAEQSPVRSCIDFSPRGGHGPGVAITSAALETGRLERDMGPLWRLCRAIAVDDMTLEQWCIERGHTVKPGGLIPFRTDAEREEILKRMAKGLPFADPDAVGIAALELKYAAGGIVVGGS